MSVTERDAPPLSWDGARLRILDQTLLPFEERVLELRGAADTAEAIRRLSVRGAPLIGVAAAYGLAMEVARRATPEALRRGLDPSARRPTDRRQPGLGRGPRTRRGARRGRGTGWPRRARAEAEAIHAEEDAASAGMAAHGAELLAGARRVLTHCNTGALAAGGRGTALGVIAGARRPRDGARAGERDAPPAPGGPADRLGAPAGPASSTICSPTARPPG